MLGEGNHICPDHDTNDGSACDQCNRNHGIEWVFTCEVCKDTSRTRGSTPIYRDTAVVVFFYEHGVDLLDPDSVDRNVIYQADEGTKVRSEDPLELLVTVELDGNRLEVTLDETATVTDVTADPE